MSRCKLESKHIVPCFLILVACLIQLAILQRFLLLRYPNIGDSML